jgi:hypothetical protein
MRRGDEAFESEFFGLLRQSCVGVPGALETIRMKQAAPLPLVAKTPSFTRFLESRMGFDFASFGSVIASSYGHVKQGATLRESRALPAHLGSF